MNNQPKTTKEIFNHHLEAFAKKDLDEIAADFNENSIYINSLGVIALGRENIIKIYQQYFETQEKGTTSTIRNMVIEGDIVFLEWTADSLSSKINDGVDTFVIRDGFIYAQTAKFTVLSKTKL